MVLIKSISGIRGTLKGKSGENLSPLDIVKYTAAYATLIRAKRSDSNLILIGRDARISGSMIRDLIFGTLVGMGWDVLDLGLSSTPTTAWAVPELKSAGGIVITASHNSQEWNALKFLNKQGELLNISEFEILLQIVQNKSFSFVSINKFGQIKSDFSIWKRHIQHILNLTGVNPKAIRKAKLTVAIDSVNSVGGIIIPSLLQALGVKNIIEIHTTPTGIFKRNPEPLPENLIEISKITKNQKADVGFAVDPDVDRLAIIMENGEPFGEEYTLISIADYVLSYKFGNTVSNISSSRALKNITEQRGYSYSASDVGEVNVVKKMKETSAVIGGEGNGGIIYPESHYGRDALVGIALFLTNLAISGKTVSELKSNYPTYYIIKHSLDLPPDIDINFFFKKIRSNYFSTSPISTMDGIKFEWEDKWMHIRKSNTEPILRLYAESTIQKEAKKLIQSVITLLSHQSF